MTLGEGPRRPRRRRTGRGAPVAIAVIAVLAVAGIVWASMRPHAEGTPPPSRRSSAADQTYSVEILADPTPVFATYRSLRINLPIRPEECTAIAFHQASRPGALHMRSLVPDANMSKAAKGKVDLKPAVPETDAPEGAAAPVLEGKVLRLWRSNRTGKPDSAVDCGAKPGTMVYAPVSGRVTEIVRYELYGKYADYEIHVTPDGWPDVDAVLLHVDALKVREGDHVEAGATPVAEVRKLSDRIAHQLRLYTGDGGDHVHLQLNGPEARDRRPGVDGS